MPRIYEGNTNDPLDFCRKHMPTKEQAEKMYNGSGEYFGYDSEHPPYNETDYRCEHIRCNRKLTDKDN